MSLAVLDGLLAVLPSTEGTGRSAWLMKYFDPVSVGVALTIVRRKVIEYAEVVLNASISISSSTFKTPEMLLVWP